MKFPTSKVVAKSVFSKPGKNVFFSFLKNSCKNSTDKFVKVEPEVCDDAVVSLKSKLSRFISSRDDEIPTL